MVYCITDIVRIANYIYFLHYIHISFISTLPAVKIRIISHFINFFPSLSVTTYFDYPDNVRCTVVSSVLYVSGYSKKVTVYYVDVITFQQPTKKFNQSFLFLRELRALRYDHFPPGLPWFVTGNAYNTNGKT